MTLWTAPPTMKVAPGNAGAKGIGVFATAAIAGGETISCDCTIPLSPADLRAVTPTVIDHYYFAHPEDDECGLLVLGLASLCNHADHPSALTVTARDPDLGWIVTLVAAHAIAAGEEITRRYACPVWFEPEAG